MKAQILKIAGVKSEKEFYSKFPSEEAFMKVHGKEFKKAQQGSAIMASFGQPPKKGLGYDPAQESYMPKSLGYNLSGDARGQQFDLSGNTIEGLSQQQSLTPQGMAGGRAGGAGAGIMGKLSGMVDLPGKIVGGIKKIKAEKEALKKAQQWEGVSDVTLAASRTRPEESKRNYVRPEDFQNTGEEFFPVYGVGTNVLAKNGKTLKGHKTEIQNTYAPNTLYDDQGYEPLPKANFGTIATGVGGDMFGQVTKQLYGQNAGSELGGDLGGAVGNMINPVVGKVLGEVGKGLGYILDPNPRKTEASQKRMQRNLGMIGANQMGQAVQEQNTSFMKEGGWVSNDWTPQVITKFGEYDMKDLLKKDPNMNTLRTGGHIRENTMDGLQVYNGDAETISQNPYLPNGGETVMFRGPSHENGGIPIKYGANGVEVEGGEPAVEMADGGKEQNLVVYGNLDASILPDPKAKGMKFKNYINMLSKDEKKNSYVADKAMENINRINKPLTSFEEIEFNSWKLNAEGADAKLQDIAKKKMTAASYQQAINETAKENNLDADSLAKGKIKQARLGTALRKAAGGDELEYLNPSDYERLTKMYDAAKAQGKGKAVEDFQREFAKVAPNRAKSVLGQFDVTNFGKKSGLQATDPSSNIDQIFGKRTEAYKSAMEQSKSPVEIGEDYVIEDTIPELSGMSNLDLQNKPVASTPPPNDKMDWLRMISGVIPYIRPSDAEAIDPRQFAGEMFAMSQNQQEPVWAQKFAPQLTTPYDISYQDVLNENTAATRGAQRMAGYNPAAQANIVAQQYGANQKVLGEQFRANQAMKNQVYAQNRQAIDNANLQNLGMFEKQMDKQAMAKSATKETAQNALQSIASKVLQNEAQNKELKVYENLYNYRFGPDMRAQNWNPLAQFNTDMGSATQRSTANVPEGFDATYKKDASGNMVVDAYKKKRKDAITRNGSIVQSFKRI